MATNEDILAYDDRPSETVKVKAWGDAEVIMKPFSARGRELFWQCVTDEDKSKGHIRATVVAMSIVDDDGVERFTAAQLIVKSDAAIQQLYDVAKRMNKLDQEDIEEAGKN